MVESQKFRKQRALQQMDMDMGGATERSFPDLVLNTSKVKG